MSPTAICGIIIGILVIACGVEGKYILKQREDIGTYKSDVAVATKANETNQKTITDLQTENQKCVKLLTPSSVAEDQARVAEEQKVKIDQLSAALERAGRADYAKPDCNKFMETDFESVCPVLASGLRTRATRSGDTGRQSGSSGRPEVATVTD